MQDLKEVNNIVSLPISLISLFRNSLNMGKLEDTLAQGVKDGKIPHAVVFATNSDGASQPHILNIEIILMQLIIEQVVSRINAPSAIIL